MLIAGKIECWVLNILLLTSDLLIAEPIVLILIHPLRHFECGVAQFGVTQQLGDKRQGCAWAGLGLIGCSVSHQLINRYAEVLRNSIQLIQRKLFRFLRIEGLTHIGLRHPGNASQISLSDIMFLQEISDILLE